MSVTFNDTTNLQGLVQHAKYLSGQDSAAIENVTRNINFGADRYSYIAMTASKRFKFDDTTNTTFSRATATLNANEASVPLETSFLIVDEVFVTGNDGVNVPLKPVDESESEEALARTYATNGVPEKYDYDSHSVFMYPKSDRERTITVHYRRAINHFSITDTTEPIGIPTIHYEYLAIYAASIMALVGSNPTLISELNNKLLAWEGVNESGGIIRNYFSKVDNQTKPRMVANQESNK